MSINIFIFIVTFHFKKIFLFFFPCHWWILSILPMWLFSVIYVIQYVIPNVLTQYLQGLMLRLSLTQMGLRSGLNVEFVSQRPAMKVQNKLWALLFHQLCPLPFNFRNQLKKKKKKTSSFPSLTPNYPGKKCSLLTGLFWELMPIFHSLPQAAVLGAMSSMAGRGVGLSPSCSLNGQA